MVKKVLFGKEARDKMLSGVTKIVDAVKVTMGANGKCVLIGNAIYGNDGLVQLPTLVTKDGYTVTRHFQLEDPQENRGAMMIKEAAMKTVEQVGDATTCTCVLAEALISNGMKLIDNGANSQQLRKGMDKALEYVIGELKKISTPVKGNIDRIRQIATVSANNDISIGNLIAEAFSKIGDEGIIDIEPSSGIETEIKISDGFKFERGWISPLFVNNPAKESCEFENPFILLYEKKITHHTQVEKAVTLAMQANKQLVIICEDADEEGLAFLAMNNHQKRIRVCVVKSPEFGTLRLENMEDIALLTGGTYISDSKGTGIKEIDDSYFGTAKKVIVSKKETTIIGGEKKGEEFDEFIADLKMNLTQCKAEDERYPIEKRIARLTGGVAVIKVGAATETELNEKLDRVDDAVRATRASISEGFVAGGGMAFLKMPKHIKVDNEISDFEKGERLVMLSLSAPFNQICENSGVNPDDILLKMKEVKSAKKTIGYNALTDEIVDMVDAGVIDSTKALRYALTNAISVAGMVLTSECVIVTTH